MFNEDYEKRLNGKESEVNSISATSLGIEAPSYSFIEEECSNMQKILQEIIENNKPLEDGVPYIGVLREVKENSVNKGKTPTIDCVYEVNGKKVYDTFVFYNDNKGALYYTMKRLTEVLSKYNYKLVPSDINYGVNAIVDICKNLIGSYVKLEQYHYKEYPKYKILATDKKENIIGEDNA